MQAGPARMDDACRGRRELQGVRFVWEDAAEAVRVGCRKSSGSIGKTALVEAVASVSRITTGTDKERQVEMPGLVNWIRASRQEAGAVGGRTRAPERAREVRGR